MVSVKPSTAALVGRRWNSSSQLMIPGGGAAAGVAAGGVGEPDTAGRGPLAPRGKGVAGPGATGRSPLGLRGVGVTDGCVCSEIVGSAVL
jgi:hypothetical protein